MNTEPWNMLQVVYYFVMLFHFGVPGQILALMLILYTILTFRNRASYI